MPYQLPDPLVVDAEGKLKPWSVQRDLENIAAGLNIASTGRNTGIFTSNQPGTLPKRYGFSARRSTTQTLTGAFAANVIVFTSDTTANEEWDPDSTYNTANGRFTPVLPGVYRLTTRVTFSGNPAFWVLTLYKNGAESRRLYAGPTSASTEMTTGGSAEVAANGTTDFFEVVALMTTGVTTTALAVGNWFQGEYLG